MMLDIKKMMENWKSPLIARAKINEFTKGAYKSNTFAVYDSLGVQSHLVMNMHIC